MKPTFANKTHRRPSTRHDRRHKPRAMPRPAADRCARQAARAALRARAARVLELPLEYMPSKEFARRGAADRILGPMPQSPGPVRKARQPAELPAYLASLYDVPLLTAVQERYLFRKYNFLKYRASKLREELDPTRPKAGLMDQIEELHDQAVETKNQILRANLRLVVSIAKKYVFGAEDLFERVSEGNISLMKAIEKFNYMLGFKFSTYATWAIRKNYAREYATTARYVDRFRTSQEERLDWTSDERSNGYALEREQETRENQVAKILGCLSEREREIISLRYGLGASPEGKTLKEVGNDFGISKERIRQIATRALAKLRDAAVAENIEAL